MLKILKRALVLLFLLQASSLSALAHSSDQPPFFKINGIFSELYPVPGVSTQGIAIPEDAAPKNYLVNEKIEFQIDLNALGIPKDVIHRTTLYWDFDDGTKLTGSKVTHSYKSAGSYFVRINAKTPEMSQPQELETVMLHVLPNVNSPLPITKIFANKQSTNNPASEPLYFDLKQPIDFFVSVDPPTIQIKDITWDFGDGTTATGQSVTHSYPYTLVPGGLSIVTAVARVRTQDGLMLDNFVLIHDQSLNPSPNIQPESLNNTSSLIAVISGGFIVLLIVVILLLIRKNGRK